MVPDTFAKSLYWLLSNPNCPHTANCQNILLRNDIIFVLTLMILDLGVCPEPGGEPNAARSGAVFPYHPGDTVTYSCSNCYTGGGTIKCDGKSWSGNMSCSGRFLPGKRYSPPNLTREVQNTNKNKQHLCYE